MSDKTLLLVDGSSYLYRAYHALPDLRSPSGFPTGAIHGVVAMMKLLRTQYPALHGACVFDDKGTTFRDAWYPEYKATRSAMPPDLAEPTRAAPTNLVWLDATGRPNASAHYALRLLADAGVDGATVKLSGTVHSWQERSAAQGVAWSAPGVQAVINKLRVG